MFNVCRFVFVVPAVSSPSIKLHIAHPAPSFMNAEKRNMQLLEDSLSPVCAFFHPLVSNMKTQFPELRLIQYDCGQYIICSSADFVFRRNFD